MQKANFIICAFSQRHHQQVITETKYVTLKTGQDLIKERFNPYTQLGLLYTLYR